MKKIIISSLVVMFLACAVGSSGVFAQEREPQQQKRGRQHKEVRLKRAILFELLPEQDKNELIQLRKQYREKFMEVARKKLEVKKAELEILRKADPTAFKALIAQARTKVMQRKQELKEKNPQKFEEMNKKRIGRIKRELAYLKETDPKAYEQLQEELKTGKTTITQEESFDSNCRKGPPQDEYGDVY
jgi:uncharacterized membrane protein